MKRLVFLPILLVFLCVGCVEKKVATQHGFYSTTAPSITIEFNDTMNYIGEDMVHVDVIRSKTYYYAGKDDSDSVNRLSFISIDTVPTNWYWEPKFLSRGSGPYTNIYVKNVDGEDYYCRTFISKTEKDSYSQYYKDQNIELPHFVEALVCTKKVSSNKKATFAYLRKADLNKINAVFNNERFDPDALTGEQVHYFNSVENELSAEIMARKFNDSDLQEIQ